MKTRKMVILLASFNALASAQANKAAPATTAGVTGKVFLITQGDDLKEARFAEVYALSNEQARAFKAAAIAVQPSAEQLKREANAIASPPEDAEGVIAKFACLKDRFTVLGDATGGGAKATETDEHGIFTLKLKPGVHTIVVIGKGGQNLAIWAGDVTVRAGQNNTMKLHEPVVACYDVLTH